jgi:prolyl 4-hydroxylase
VCASTRDSHCRPCHHNRFVLHNLISDAEVEQLIATATRKGMSEALITPYGSNDLVPSSTRTNTAAWLDFQQDGLVSKIENKIAEVTGTMPEDAENLQVLHYADGNQYFHEHRDYFDPKEDPPENFAQGGNRMVTVITYLKTPTRGGETYFTKLDLKLKVKPGDAIVFWNLKPDGTPDPDTYHSALPPEVRFHSLTCHHPFMCMSFPAPVRLLSYYCQVVVGVCVCVCVCLFVCVCV